MFSQRSQFPVCSCVPWTQLSCSWRLWEFLMSRNFHSPHRRVNLLNLLKLYSGHLERLIRPAYRQHLVVSCRNSRYHLDLQWRPPQLVVASTWQKLAWVLSPPAVVLRLLSGGQTMREINRRIGRSLKQMSKFFGWASIFLLRTSKRSAWVAKYNWVFSLLYDHSLHLHLCREFFCSSNKVNQRQMAEAAELVQQLTKIISVKIPRGAVLKMNNPLFRQTARFGERPVDRHTGACRFIRFRRFAALCGFLLLCVQLLACYFRPPLSTTVCYWDISTILLHEGIYCLLLGQRQRADPLTSGRIGSPNWREAKRE
eukprot:284817394_6